MPSWKDVTEIGLALPQTEVSTWYRTPGMKVAGKGFLRLRTEAEGGLVDGYGAVLINLEKVARADLEYLITESWRRRAPLKLLKEFDLRSESLKTPTRPARGTRTRRLPARKGS
jgi:hypothetical protein